MSVRDHIQKKLEGILARVPDGEAEIVYRQNDQQLTRFGANEIVQNVGRHTEEAWLRWQKDGRRATVAIHQFTEDGINKALNKAKALMAILPVDPQLLPVLQNAAKAENNDGFSHQAVDHDPKIRAEVVGRISKRARAENVAVAGRYQVDVSHEAYLNSHGLYHFHAGTDCTLSNTVTALDGQSEGWGLSAHHDPTKVDVEGVMEKAFGNAQRGKNAEGLSPGRYTVILDSPAVSELLHFLCQHSFNGEKYLDKRSYVSGHLGEKFFSESVNLRDNPYDDRLPGRPWDYEGSVSTAPKLIEEGHVTKLCWDRRNAHRAGLESSGHSSQHPNIPGPSHHNVIMEGDDKVSLQDLIAGTDKALLLSRLHYCNTVDAMKVSVTGMTRSGVFEIKNGRVVRPLKNFRFTVSLLDIFNKIDGLSSPERAEGALFGARFVAPAVRLHDFQITSVTEF